MGRWLFQELFESWVEKTGAGPQPRFVDILFVGAVCVPVLVAFRFLGIMVSQLLAQPVAAPPRQAEPPKPAEPSKPTVEQPWQRRQKAFQNRDNLLQVKPTGAADAAVVPHVLEAVAQSLGGFATFTHQGGGGKTFSSLITISGDGGDSDSWSLSLNNLPSWAGASTMKALQDQDPGLKSFKKKAAERLAKWLNVSAERVTITEVPDVNNPNISFTVAGITAEEASRAVSAEGLKKLKASFSTLVDVSLPPLLRKLEFDLDELDTRGNKDFPANGGGTFQVGPLGKEEAYEQPKGWYRYGLKVKGKYADGDAWLDPFQDPGNWYRAFHGTGNAHSQGTDAGSAVKSIYTGGFRPSSSGFFGPGVYVSPRASFSGAHYCGATTLKTTTGEKKMEFILQVAVDPKALKKHCDNIWTVPGKEHVRPYGLLVKEG